MKVVFSRQDSLSANVESGAQLHSRRYIDDEPYECEGDVNVVNGHTTCLHAVGGLGSSDPSMTLTG